MAKGVKIKHKWNLKEFDRIRNSPEIQKVLQENAEKVIRATGDGYGYRVVPGKARAHAYIRPLTYKAKRDNQDNNTLIKALRGGG